MAPDSKVTRPCVALSKSSAASTISGAGLRRGKCPHDYKASRISKMVLSTVNLGPPRFTVDTTIFEMQLGSLSKHTGLAIPVL